MKITITSIVATPVVVPSRPDSIMSPGIEDDWSKAKGIGNTSGGSTANFPELPKYILVAGTNKGLVGLGETYRAVDMDNLKRNAHALVGCDLESLKLNRLPFPLDREYDGFELLIYDLMGQAHKLPVYQLLGGRCRDKVECSMWTGRRTPEDAGRKAREGKERGFDAIKFKCNDQDDLPAWARQVQEQCGPDMRMIFDPNQRWGDYETAKRIMEQLGEFNVLGIEDPIDRNEYAGYRDLRGVGGLKVVIHIALPYVVHGQSITDIITAIREDCSDAFNFNGSMARFVELAAMGELEGKPCWHGSEVDLGILEAGYVHAAAAAPACTWPSDIFGRLVREHDLLEKPLKFEGKYVHVPTRPGLGVELDIKALEKYRVGPDIDLTK